MAENIENIPLYQIKANIETHKKIAEIQKLNEQRQELLALPERYNIQKQKIEDDLSKIKNPKSHNYLVISQQLRMINLEIANLGSLMSEIPKIEKRIDDLHNYIQGLPDKYRNLENLEKNQLNRGSRLPSSNQRNFGGKKKSRKQLRKKRRRTYKRK
jgi:hypothetical protein